MLIIYSTALTITMGKATNLLEKVKDYLPLKHDKEMCVEEYIDMIKNEITVSISCTQEGNFIKHWDERNSERIEIWNMSDRLYEYVKLVHTTLGGSGSADGETLVKCYESFIRTEKLNKIL